MRFIADYIIVGAGSAGCVLANRLSVDPDVNVLLLEAGPPDTSWMIRMPAAIPLLYKGKRYNWRFETVPQTHLDGRRIYHPRGRTLGGTSSINGMIFMRGHARDFDHWADGGATGWSYAEVLPYFRRLENYSGGANKYRGEDGPVCVITKEPTNPLDIAFLEAGRQAGYPASEDVNGFQQEGFGKFDINIDGGIRASSAFAYLRPARKRPNLRVLTGALTTRIIFEKTRATGIEFLQRGMRYQARAEREVIVASGAFQSPQLLLLSGVGPADELSVKDIPVIQDLPGVGCNLQDHPEIHVQYEATEPVSLNGEQRWHRRAIIGLEWFLLKRGLGTSSGCSVGSFIRSSSEHDYPDIEYHFFPLYLGDSWWPPREPHGFSFGAGPMREESRGTVKLGSGDPREPPLIDPNYLATEADREAFREVVALSRELANQRAFDQLRGREIEPGTEIQGDRDIDAFVKRRLESAYHPCGTCKMGTDELSVVDQATRVHGLEQLRVVDASIMPNITNANLNAPVMMIAEKAADMILGKEPLPPRTVPVYKPEDKAPDDRGLSDTTS